MGRQTRFFAIDADERALLDAAAAVGARAVPKITRTGAPIAPVPPTDLAPSSHGGVIYLLPRGVPVDAAVYEPTRDPTQSVLIPFESAVVEIVGSRKAAGAIEDGRVYFSAPRSSQWFNAARHDFERLSRWIKKWESAEGVPCHVGPAAAAEVRAGRLRLRHAGQDISLAKP